MTSLGRREAASKKSIKDITIISKGGMPAVPRTAGFYVNFIKFIT